MLSKESLITTSYDDDCEKGGNNGNDGIDNEDNLMIVSTRKKSYNNHAWSFFEIALS